MCELYNDLFILVYQGRFSATIYDEVRVCIGDTSLIKYPPKNINLMININNITCRFETCISAVLNQNRFNK